MEQNVHIDRFFRTMQIVAKNEVPTDKVVDFGEIQGDMKLKTYSYAIPIPQEDYFVCRSVQWGKVDDEFYKTKVETEHIHEVIDTYTGGGTSRPTSHLHTTLVGEKYRSIKPGDKVLVVWVGNTACVVDIIYPATVLG